MTDKTDEYLNELGKFTQETAIEKILVDIFIRLKSIEESIDLLNTKDSKDW